MPFYQIMLAWASQYKACAIEDIPLEAVKQLPDWWSLKDNATNAAARYGAVGVRFQNGKLAGYASGSYLNLSQQYNLQEVISFDDLMNWLENEQQTESVFDVCLEEVL